MNRLKQITLIAAAIAYFALPASAQDKTIKKPPKKDYKSTLEKLTTIKSPLGKIRVKANIDKTHYAGNQLDLEDKLSKENLDYLMQGILPEFTVVLGEFGKNRQFEYGVVYRLREKDGETGTTAYIALRF